MTQLQIKISFTES